MLLGRGGEYRDGGGSDAGMMVDVGCLIRRGGGGGGRGKRERKKGKSSMTAPDDILGP